MNLWSGSCLYIAFVPILLCLRYVCNASRIFSVYPKDDLSKIVIGVGLSAPQGRPVLIRLVGEELSTNDGVFFTTNNASCSLLGAASVYRMLNVAHDNTSAVIKVQFEAHPREQDFWYICLILTRESQMGPRKQTAVHQGSEEWLRIHVLPGTTDQFFLPIWLRIIICVILLLFSGLFSGLNLGLMSLDQTELKIIQKVGSPHEKKHAQRIAPLRKRGNLLLCSILLGNVLVNTTFTILFEEMTSSLLAVICSTAAIVVFGEIMPQAICSRHGLAVGAKTYWITVIFIIITFPAAFPISLVLDCLLGEEMGQAFNKEKLQELIRMNTDRRILRDNEANIISGALQLNNKSVADVMTQIEDVYMLEINTILDFETITEIMHQGYTRIPVYDGDKTNIINLLNTKELALIDPDDKTLLSTVCRFYDHRPLFVDHDVKLDAMLQAFLQAGSSHMAIVQKLHSPVDHDPYFENLGVITLEDVIEEILQSEIVDETDLKMDNRHSGQPLLKQKEDYELLVPEARNSSLPKHLAFAAFQFLTTTVEPFSDVHLARNVLKTLMRKDIVVTLCPSDTEPMKNYIFQKGVPTDKFVLILQGSVEVEIGDESMVFETGPFSYFGVECINRSRLVALSSDDRSKDYIPDFSVRALTDVQYVYITKNMYIAALRTTRMLRERGSTIVGDAFETEYEKVKKNENHSSCDCRSECVFRRHGALLDAIKTNESAKKRSTMSLDRPLFFCKKPDSYEGLYQGTLTGSNPGDHSSEYKNIFDDFLTESGVNAQLNTLLGDRDTTPFGIINASDKSKFPSSTDLSCRNEFDASGEDDNNDHYGSDKRDETERFNDVVDVGLSCSNKVSTIIQCTESTAGGDMQTDHHL